MSNSIVMRSTSPNDAAALKAALAGIWHKTYDGFLGADRVTKLSSGWHTLEKLASEALAEHVCSLIALDGNNIIGHALMYEPQPSTLHLARLYLDQKFHGQGIGKQLLNKAIQSYPHASKAYLEVYEPNLRAVEFYKRQGFKIVERMRDIHTDDVLFEYRMEKEFEKNVE